MLTHTCTKRRGLYEKADCRKPDNSLKAYRRMLLNKKAETLVALGINCRSLAAFGEEAGADQEAISHEEFLRVRVNRVLYGQLQQMDAALERMELGEYGICKGCGNPIPGKRLKAVPWTSHCVLCQEKNVLAEPVETVAMGEEE